MLKVNYESLLSQLNVLKEIKREHKFNIDTHGYDKNTNYAEFKFQHSEKIEISDFFFIDEVQHSYYGFLVYEAPYSDSSELIDGQDNTTIEIESVTLEPFKNTIIYNFIIKGLPRNIDLISQNNPFIVGLTLTGCLRHSPYWQQSLYLSYLMYKQGNILSSFMHLFITFEGLLRSYPENQDGDFPSLHDAYYIYTNQQLPEYLNVYRTIRNQVMHGNENIASKLTFEDLGNLINTIQNLLFDETPVCVYKNTKVLRLFQQYKDKNKEQKKRKKSKK